MSVFLFMGSRSVFAEEAACKLPLTASAGFASVAKVVDGDTVYLDDGRKVRMQGINAPEVAHKDKPADPFGDEAKQALTKWMPNKVRVWVGAEIFDHYGRTLGTLFTADGENLNAKMVREGLAYHISFPPELTFLKCYRDADKVARDHKLGIWAHPIILQAFDDKFKSGFGLVEGVVKKVDHTRVGHWVNLDGDFAFYVRDKDAQYFPGLQLSDLVGKKVLVRGWVIDRSAQKKPQKSGQKRWMIKVQHSSALEIMK